MKTAEEILQDKETFDENYPVVSINDALEAMKEYAEQFIDEACEVVQLECTDRTSDIEDIPKKQYTDNTISGLYYYIDIDCIQNLKEKLL